MELKERLTNLKQILLKREQTDAIKARIARVEADILQCNSKPEPLKLDVKKATVKKKKTIEVEVEE
jgi:hypothetical protein